MTNAGVINPTEHTVAGIYIYFFEVVRACCDMSMACKVVDFPVNLRELKR
jgi:hypothetical protein